MKVKKSYTASSNVIEFNLVQPETGKDLPNLAQIVNSLNSTSLNDEWKRVGMPPVKAVEAFVNVTTSPPLGGDGSSGGLSGGAIAGIVIGCVVGVVFLIGLMVFLMKSKSAFGGVLTNPVHL
eukprot:TRINITY_DN9576_c0_g1_i1.p1 TRINITY_DN9576_c0_g1~~TRINITY_DN9576_c0_g1_i1.p1  ORF type:complete len:122 (+),score=17.26 TRINITY_DN9576_c0_g1_i1:89-454(+)